MMTDITIPNTTGDIKIGELTDADVNGNGVFDVLMRSVKAHLQQEYDAQRIRGTDYANAYVQSIAQVMQMANAYTLAKAKLPLELQLLEAEILKVATDTAVATKQGGLFDAQILNQMAQTNQTNKQTELKLPAEVEQIKTQTGLIKTQDELAEYDLEHKQPIEKQVLQKQVDQLNAQTNQVTKQTEVLDYELKNKLPKEVELMGKDLLIKQQQVELANKELLLKQYELTHIKPKELAMLTAEVAIKQKQLPLMEKEISLKQNQIDLGIKELGVKENQITLGYKEIALKEKQLPIMERELAIKGQQLKLAEYEFNYKAPAEVGLIDAQTQLYGKKANTEQAQTDGSVIRPNSVMYWTNKLTEEQSKTYQRDAEQKVAKLLIDSWSVRYNADPDNPYVAADGQNELENGNIGKAIRKMGETVGINF